MHAFSSEARRLATEAKRLAPIARVLTQTHEQSPRDEMTGSSAGGASLR
jgi:hypothetical protein